MNEKEIAEIRRRIKPDKSNITHIRGCYVNEKHEIIAEFNQPLALMPQEECETMLATLKKTLSGTPQKNLLDIAFATQQVVDSDEHRLLMALRSAALDDTETMQAFFARVIESLTLEGSYMILLVQDKYDVPYRSKDGLRQEDASSEVFSYILCAICPIKMTKPALGYSVFDNEFHNYKQDCIVAPPALGFMFPAFDDRGSNIYNALYYSRDAADNHSGFTDAVFNCEIAMPADAQKETFEEMLEGALAADCSYQVVQTVHSELRGMVELHKANKEEAPLVVSKGKVRDVLESCGVSEERVADFEQRYDSAFGAETDLSPRNLVNTKQFEVRTPDITIRINPERSELVETRIINGIKYILIRAEEGVEVNGVAVHL